jgi:vacuolar-type H+-ATPase subunit F/Vma7
VPAPIFIGDEISAAAYRLAGARTRVPPVGETNAALHWACSNSDLVLITAEYARHLAEEDLMRARARVSPLILLVPDICGRVPLPDLATQLRSQLGVEA